MEIIEISGPISFAEFPELFCTYNSGGSLLTSGILSSDIQALEIEAKKHGLR